MQIDDTAMLRLKKSYPQASTNMVDTCIAGVVTKK